MRTALIISLLGLGAACALPAAADPDPHRHQHGQAAEAEAPPQHQHGGDTGPAGGGMMKGGMMGGGMMHGRMKHCEHGGGEDDLKERIRQLEKRLDLMQTTLELLAGRQGGGCPHHCEMHGEQR